MSSSSLHRLGRLILLLLILILTAVGTDRIARCEEPESDAAAEPIEEPRAALEPVEGGVPIIYRGKEVWRLYLPHGAFSARKRAEQASENLDKIVFDKQLRPEDLHLVHLKTTSEIRLGDRTVGVLRNQDAAYLGIDRRLYAEQALERMRSLVIETREELSTRSRLIGGAIALVATLVLMLALYGTRRLSRRVRKRIRDGVETARQGVRIQRLELIPAAQLARILDGLVRGMRAITVVALVVTWAQVVLQALPWTRPYARWILAVLAEPAARVWQMLVALLPNVVYLILIVVVSHGLLRLIWFFFQAIERGTLRIGRFAPEWALPTYKIVRVLLIALAFVAAFPYLPGSGSPAFQGVTVFLGLLISLSSSSAIANVIAGVILTYTRAFRLGDHVKIADTSGDVIETSLLVTQLKTPKNVVVSVPNSIVLGAHIVNYSQVARHQGVILHTSVTIGYDTDWRRVHALLIEAARQTQDVLSEPSPFVLQTALNDFHVSYEINVHTERPGRMGHILSELHTRIQDEFQQAGLEIMSPFYGALRDGNTRAIPSKTETTPGDHG